MEEDVKRKIEEIMAGMKCPKDFKCAECGFSTLCKAQEVGLEKYLKCIEEGEAARCPFAVPLGYDLLCQCPLRVYIAKKLNK